MNTTEGTSATAVGGSALSEGLGLAEEMAEPYLHILTDDLPEMQRRETTAIVASVSFGTPDRGHSEPLVRHSTAEAYREAVAAALRHLQHWERAGIDEKIIEALNATLVA